MGALESHYILKMPSLDMITCRETFVPFVHSVIDDTVPSRDRPVSDAASVHQRHDFDECRKCVSMHTSMTKKDILAFNLTQKYTNNNVYLVNFVNNMAER